MKKKITPGKIATFYSFKGGVGRTMALANVAYLAATNGYKVLIMDWDLEAPGLAYYFRALLEAQDAKKLKDHPGVLDMLWQWSASIRSCTSEGELDEILYKYDSGDEFSKLIFSLNTDHFNEYNGILDYVGAGGRSILTPEPMAYEDALTNFSWTGFFNEEAGGVFIEKFRDWAKSNYDLVLIDSRTGLADVAGICTLQIPDVVALCFILNRQNIDGVAKVASAIRTRRKEALPILAVPMRITRSDTAEESDARARAFTELTRVGGFSTESVTEDFKKFAIKASESIPFYETLAPLAATTPQLDPLSINYLQLATHLLEKIFTTPISLAIPRYDEKFLELARRRLQPRHATVEYISKLRSAEPARMIDELNRLVEGALETEMDGGGLEDGYIIALANAAIEVGAISEDPFVAQSIQIQVLDLLRIKSISNPEQWKPHAITILERSLDEFSFMHDDEEELALLEEIDRLLSDSLTNVNRLKRIRRRRQSARIFLRQGNYDAVMQTIGELSIQIKDLQKFELPMDQKFDLLCAEIDLSILKGDTAKQRENPTMAISEYESGLYTAVSIDMSFAKSEAGRLLSELNIKLATSPQNLMPLEKAAQHALLAVKWGTVGSWIPHFCELSKPIIRSRNLELALNFTEETMSFHERVSARNSFVNYFGRQLRFTLDFLDCSTRLIEQILNIEKIDRQRIKDAIEGIASTANGVLRNILRRRSTMGDRPIAEISASLERLIHLVDVAEVSADVQDEMRMTFNRINHALKTNVQRGPYQND